MKRLILVGALAAAALAIGIAWPPPPVPARSAADEQWSLPEEAALTRFAAPEFSEATRKLRWSADRAGQAGAGADGALPWRLAGIAADGHSVALLMTLGKDATAHRLAIGDALPDGSRLAAIEGDTITIEQGGCRLVYQLYHSQPVRATGECPDHQVATEQRDSQ